MRLEDDTVAGNPPGAVLSFSVLKQRSDFLRAARGVKKVTPGFILQIRNRRDASADIRVGFTCSKKVGNAVARNRAKRRLRALAASVLPLKGKPGHDYVLIGRAGKTAERRFATLEQELVSAL